MNRFYRDYELVIGIGDNAIVINPPFRVAFTADKSVDKKLNKLTLKVYNLKEETRLKIVKLENDKTHFPVSLKIGYDGKKELIFKGSIVKCANMRDVAEFCNELECLDGGADALGSFTSNTVKGTNKNIIETILADMPNTSKGKITSGQNLIRPKVLVGNSADLIERSLAPDEDFFIDNEQLYIIKKNEVISEAIPVVSAQSGLIDTPRNTEEKTEEKDGKKKKKTDSGKEKTKGEVSFKSLLNPTLRVGGLCEIQSKTAPHVNGLWKIVNIQYVGDSEGNDWFQTVECQRAKDYTVVK